MKKHMPLTPGLAMSAALLYCAGCQDEKTAGSEPQSSEKAPAEAKESGKAAVAPSMPGAPKAGEVRCLGIHECKGKSQCHTKEHACAGQNECKGKGWIVVPSEECSQRGGKALDS